VTAPRPLTADDRREVEAFIAARWPRCCADVGLRNRTQPWFADDGSIGGAPGHPVDEGSARALEGLACELEDELCLDVVREPGQPPRVLGWATYRPGRWQDGCAEAGRITDLAVWHEARDDWHDRIHHERMARREAAMGWRCRA
jgi:hypothetical protein